MITTTVLLSLLLAKTDAALKLRSPIRFIRPLDDIHNSCGRDVEEFCKPPGTNIQLNDMHKSMLTNENIKIEKDGDWKILDLLRPHIARRLNELENVTTKISISIGIYSNPKESKESIQHVKNNERFLNYGPKTDTCLWNAFDANRVSLECASALTYLNGTPDSSPLGYDADSHQYTKTTRVSLSFSIFPLITLILVCVLIKEIYRAENNDVSDEAREYNKNINSMDYEYQFLDDSKQIPTETAFVAVPMNII